LILRSASDLFSQQGYTATTIKQIAEGASCTTAALYYYFKDGKEQILREVIHSYSHDLFQIVAEGAWATSLPAVLAQLGQAAARVMPTLLPRLNWLIPQFGSLPPTEQSHLQHLIADIHAAMATAIKPFVNSPVEANTLAALLFFTHFGYEQITFNLGLHRLTNLTHSQFAATIADVLAAGATALAQSDPHTN